MLPIGVLPDLIHVPGKHIGLRSLRGGVGQTAKRERYMLSSCLV